MKTEDDQRGEGTVTIYPIDLVWKKHSSNLEICEIDKNDPRLIFLKDQIEELEKGEFQFIRFEFIKNNSLLNIFREKMKSLEDVRNTSNLGLLLNSPVPGIDDGEKQEILDHYKTLLIPTGPNKKSNLLELWHGCSPGACFSICNGGAKDLRTNDGGFFGSGIYLTPNINYAASMYSTTGNPDIEERTVLFCKVVVSRTYPISRRTDYDEQDPDKIWSISKFHYNYPIPQDAIRQFEEQSGSSLLQQALTKRMDKALMSGFDSHFIAVSSRYQYHSVPLIEADNFELVVKEEAQVLPIGILYFKYKSI